MQLTERTSPFPAYGSGPHPEWLGYDWSQHLRWIEVDGRPVNVLDIGEGDPVFFVHGHVGCWQHWLDQIPGLMKRHRVIAVDLPGFGRSPMPAEGISISGYARTLESICETLGLDAACFVGSSMGGFTCAEMAVRFPQRVERLVLVAAAGLSGHYVGLPTAFIKHPGAAAVARIGFSLSGVPKPQRRMLASRPRGRKFALGMVMRYPELISPAIAYEYISAAGKPGAAPASVELASYDFRHRLGDIACPTLIVWGDRDRIVSVKCAPEYQRLIPDAKLMIYDDTGHLPMTERPARFNADLEAFLAE